MSNQNFSDDNALEYHSITYTNYGDYYLGYNTYFNSLVAQADSLEELQEKLNRMVDSYLDDLLAEELNKIQ